MRLPEAPSTMAISVRFVLTYAGFVRKRARRMRISIVTASVAKKHVKPVQPLAISTQKKVMFNR